MSKQKETARTDALAAGKTAETTRRRATAQRHPDTKRGKKGGAPMSDALVLQISGNRLENLRRVADAMNTVKWCEADNTPRTVFRNFVFAVANEYLNDPAELAAMVLSIIDTGHEPGTPEHDGRIGELRRAFEAAGLIGKGATL